MIRHHKHSPAACSRNYFTVRMLVLPGGGTLKRAYPRA